jgi:hypothetical protein
VTPGPPTSTRPTEAKLAKLPATPLSRFASRGVKVSSACETGLSGRIRVTLARKAARKLGLKRTTIASKPVRCGGDDRVTARLKPSRSVARALRKARGSVSAKVTITMGVGDVASSSSRRLVLKR